MTAEATAKADVTAAVVVVAAKAADRAAMPRVAKAVRKVVVNAQSVADAAAVAATANAAHNANVSTRTANLWAPSSMQPMFPWTAKHHARNAHPAPSAVNAAAVAVAANAVPSATSPVTQMSLWVLKAPTLNANPVNPAKAVRVADVAVAMTVAPAPKMVQSKATLPLKGKSRQTRWTVTTATKAANPANAVRATAMVVTVASVARATSAARHPAKLPTSKATASRKSNTWFGRLTSPSPLPRLHPWSPRHKSKRPALRHLARTPLWL